MIIRKLNLIFFILLFYPALELACQVELGFYGGPTMLQLKGDRPKLSVYRPGPGMVAGAIINFPLAKDIQLSVQPGFSIENARSRTADTIYYRFDKELKYRDSIYFRLNSGYLPVLMSILSDNHRFQFTTGFEFIYMFNIRADNGQETFNIDNQYRKFNVAAQFGAGYVIPIKQSRLSLNLQYSQSLFNWSDNDPESSVIPRIKSSGKRFIIAWSIPVSNKKQQKQ